MKNQHKKGDKHTYIRCAFYNRRDAQRINGQKIQTLIIVYDKMKTAKLLRPAEFVVILAIGIAEGEKKLLYELIKDFCRRESSLFLGVMIPTVRFT